MRILIACEFSGIVRDAFAAKGHDAWSCDLLPSERPGKHIQGDVLEHLNDGWDLMIAHPPCTYLCVTGNKWFKPEYAQRFPNRSDDRHQAVIFFQQLTHAPVEKIAIENPVGIMSSIWRKPDQYIQPWQFGDKAAKKTGLWLKNLPSLEPTKNVEPEYRVYNSTTHKSGKSRYPVQWFCPSKKNWRDRVVTYPGIAAAMADQWGKP